MTDMPRNPESLAPAPALSCADVATQLPAYAAGTLSEHEARAIEWHAAHCHVCESLLDRLLEGTPSTRDAAVLVEQVRLDREESRRLRRATLGRLGGMRPRARWSRLWMVPAGALLAASLVLLVRTPFTEDTADRTDDTLAETDTAWAAFSGAATAPMRSAVRLAREQAAPEFAALDTATREIERAIAAAPGDDALRGFRDALEARRRELEVRVARVTE